MFRRCHGSPRVEWCWIANHTYHAGLDRTVRTNMANLSTTSDYPPYASGGRYINRFREDNATNGNPDRPWVSGTLSPTQYLTFDLHPTYVDNLILTWWYTSGYDLTTTHAIAYDVQVRTEANPTWTTVYMTSTSNGFTDTITLPGNLLATGLRLNLTTPATSGHHYAIADLKAYGEVEDIFFQRGANMADWVTNNPGQLWLMGNEPNNFDINFGDGLSPTIYANLYITVASLIKDNDPTAQLVFCQGTVASWNTPTSLVPDYRADQFPYQAGSDYCMKAQNEITRLLTLNNSPYTFADLVQGVSTHQYITPPIFDTNLAQELDIWKFRLNEFQTWVNSQTALAGKPLYLTEYGDYDNICPYPIPKPPDPPPLGCGPEIEGYAFYGDHYQEGYWAILHHTTEYFLSPANTQWYGAWWFYVGDADDPEQANRGDVYLDKTIPLENLNGFRYRDSLNCHLNGVNCP